MARDDLLQAPYLGPRPFERQHALLFFGRSAEANALLSLVIAHRSVLVYAPSGAGKTSLLNAGLLPLLEGEEFQILPSARVRGLAPEGLAASAIANIFVFNALLSWAPVDADVAALAQLTLATFLAQQPHPVDDLGLPVPRVAIFDQFEELFASHPERWEDRARFFAQVAEALEGDSYLRVVFAMREDYLGQVEPYAGLLPERLQTRFRLSRLGKDAALDAVIRPLAGTHKRFAEGVAEKLVGELLQVRVESGGDTLVVAGETVEPVQLQVVCRNLWDGLPADAAVITEDHLQTFGDVDQALMGFYERSLRQTVEASGVPEGDLRAWFDRSLITPAGTRGTVYRGADQTDGIANRAVDILENLHVIRGEWRAGARWYELTHDRFIAPIQGSNEQWLGQRREAEQARQWLEGKAAEWAGLGRGRGGLLDEVELANAERWLAILRAAAMTTGEDLPALMAASRAAIDAAAEAEEAARQRELDQARALADEQRRRAEAEQQRAETQAATTRRLRVLVVALGLVLLAAVLAAVFALSQQRVARSNQQLAEQRAGEALDAQATAEAEVVMRSTAEAEAQREQQTAATRAAEAVAAQATAEAEVVMRSTAEAEAQRNEQTAATRAAEAVAAQATAQAERDRFEEQRRIATAGDLAASAIGSLTDDPERSLLLALAASSATSSADGTVRVEAESALHQALGAARLRTSVPAHRFAVNAAATSKDGLRLVTVGDDSTARLWDIAATTALTTLDDLPDMPTTAAISPDGSTIAVGGSTGSVTVWDAATGRQVRKLAGHATAPVQKSAFNPEGRYLATAAGDGSIALWSTAPVTAPAATTPAEAASTWFAHDGAAHDVDFSPECLHGGPGEGCDRLLATAGADGLVKLWRLTEATTSGQLAVDAQGVLSLTMDGGAMAVAFSPDGRSLAASGTDLATRVWEIVPPQIVGDAGWSAAERLALRRDAGTAVDVTFSPDGRYLAEAGDDGTARVWLVADGGAAEPALTPGNLVAAIAGHTGPVWSAGFVRQCAGANDVPGEPCQQRLVTAGQDGAIYLWEPATGRFAGSLAGHPAAAFDVAFAPSGTLLASAGQDNTVKLWSIPADVVKPGDAFSVTLTATLAGHTGWVRSLAFSRDGTRVATGSDDTTARIWDPRTGQALLTLAGHRGPVAGVAFSPDGRRLATASWDKTARVWDAATGDLLATLTGHAGAVNSVAFSPDGTKLVTASDDTTVKVWDSTTGDGLATLDGHANEVNDAVFDDGGNVIASAGRDMTVRLWDAASGQELDTLSGHADTIFGLAMSGRELASASGDRTARVWRLPVGYGTATQVGTVDEELRLAGNQASILGVAFSPDRRRLATAAIDGAVNVYSLGPSEEVVTLVDHRQEILSLGVSADGKRLATSTADGVVTVWDGDTGAELLALNDPGGGWIWDVSLSSTCDAAAEADAARCRPRMATAGSDGTTRVWDAATGEELLDLKGHRGAVRGVAYSPDNTRLATTGDDGTARLWDAETGEERFTLADHPGPVVGGGFSGDGTKLGTVSFDSQAGRYQVRIWDLATGTELAAPACQAAGDEVFTLSTDFTRLAIGKPDGRIVLCAAATGETIWEAGGGLERVAAFDFSRDDTRLLAVAQGRGKMFDVATGQVVLDFPLPVTAPWFAGLTGLQDGSSQRVVVAGLDGPATVWQLPPGAGGDGQAVVERATIVPDPAAVTAVAESPDQGLLAAASANRTVKLWDTSSYQALATLAGHALAISSVAFAPACAGRPDATANVCETTRMATAGDDGKVVVWSLRPAPEAAGPRLVASEVLTLTGHAGGTTSVAFSPDGARLATVGGDAMVRLWDAATGAALGALAGHGDVVRSVTFSPNGERVATASWDGTARLWDAATGQQILMVEDRGRGLEDVAFSPDGAQLATADADGIAKIWSVESGQELQTLLGHVGAVLSLAYSPDGRRLASAGDDGTIRLWNPLTGEQEMVLPAEGPVRDVAFSPDGRRLIAGGTDGAVRVYALDAKELQSLAGRRVARPPTVQECQKYLRQQVCPAPGVTTTPVVAP